MSIQWYHSLHTVHGAHFAEQAMGSTEKEFADRSSRIQIRVLKQGNPIKRAILPCAN